MVYFGSTLKVPWKYFEPFGVLWKYFESTSEVLWKNLATLETLWNHFGTNLLLVGSFESTLETVGTFGGLWNYFVNTLSFFAQSKRIWSTLDALPAFLAHAGALRATRVPTWNTSTVLARCDDQIGSEKHFYTNYARWFCSDRPIKFRKRSKCVRNRQNSTWCAYLALTTERKQEKLCRLPYLFVRLHICHACLAHWDRHVHRVHRKCWRNPLLQTKAFNTPHVCNLMPFVRVIVHPGLWLSTENADLFYMFHRPRFFHKIMDKCLWTIDKNQNNIGK